MPSAEADPLIHAPIKIIGNAGLGVGCAPNVANGVTGGCGTATSPYVIENWIIDGALTPELLGWPLAGIGQARDGGIYVESTTAFLVMRNLTVQNFPGPQIHLKTTMNVIVEYNTIKTGAGLIATQAYGIQVEGGSAIELKNNTISCPIGNLPRGIETFSNPPNVVIRGTSVSSCFVSIAQSGANGLIEDNIVNGPGGLGAAGSGTIVRRNIVTGTANTGISFNGAGPITISHNLVTSNSGVGIVVAGSSGSVTDNVVTNNVGGGIQASVNGAFFTFSGNNIAGNTAWGVCACSTTVIDFRDNWWGDSSGPSGAGGGTGDAIYVPTGAATPLFNPWLSSENPNAGP